MQRYIAAAMLVAAALVVGPALNQSQTIKSPQSFEDSFSDNWSQFGQLTNLTEEEEYIIADQGSSGTFISDDQYKESLTSLNSVEVTADLTSPGETSTVEVQTLIEGSIVQEQSFTLENGQNYYQLDQINETADSYRFRLNMAEGELVNHVDITGQVNQAEDLNDSLGTIVRLVLFALAILMVLTGRR